MGTRMMETMSTVVSLKQAKMRRTARKGAWMLVLAALVCAIGWLLMREQPEQPALTRHVTEKYGPTLKALGVTKLKYDDGTFSTTRTLDADGKTLDLTIKCSGGCGSTLFLGEMTGFIVRLKEGSYRVQADIDTSSVSFDRAAEELDKALEGTLDAYRRQKEVDASWKR